MQATRSCSAILFQKTQSCGEKFDRILSTRFATVTVYPQVPLGIRYDLFTGQIAHVFVADSRKTGKEKQVAVVFVFGTLQSCRLKNPQFLLAEKGSRFRRSGIAVKCERIPRHKTVVERNFHHVIIPTIHVATYASRLRTADSFQIDVVLLDERLFQFEQRNMVEVVLVFQKGTKMTQYRPIAPPGTFRAIYADTFEKIIRVMFENLRKGPVSFSHTQPDVLDLFSRDVSIVIANRLIVFADLDADIVQMAVDAFRLDALAFDPSLL